MTVATLAPQAPGEDRGTVRSPGASRWYHRLLAVEVALAVALRAAVGTRPLGVLDRFFVPDDTYYTLTIARSLAHGNGPSTDGHTLTSGFQPLLAFLLVPVAWVTNRPDVLLRADIVLLLACDLAIVVLLAHIARRLAGPVAGLIAAGIWAVSPAALRVAVGGLETSLAMLCEIGLVALWMRTTERPSTRAALLLGGVAALAALARIDAVILVALLVAITLWRGPRQVLAGAALGAAVVAGPWWLWCTVRFGSPVPASGMAARALQGNHSFQPFVLSLSGTNSLIGPFGAWSKWEASAAWAATTWPFWLSLAALLAAALVAVLSAQRQSAAVARDRTIAASLPLFAAALVVFYAWYGVSFYVYRYLAPVAMVVALLVGCATGAAVRVARRSTSLVATVAIGSLLVAAAVAAASGVVHGDRLALQGDRNHPDGLRSLDASTGYREGAIAMNRRVPAGTLVGSEQSGALSFYARDGRHVLNLDGVVNPDAARARHQGQLAQYIRSRHIHWFADHPLTLIRIDELLGRGPGPVTVTVDSPDTTPPGVEPIGIVHITYPDGPTHLR